MGNQIPGAKLELFEGGHLFFMEDLRAVERIGAFLRGELDDYDTCCFSCGIHYNTYRRC